MGRSSRLIAVTFLFALACSGCTWSMFGFGPDNTRFNPIVTGLSASNVGTMVVKGTATTGGPIDSSPAVVTTGANGTLTSRVYVGSNDHKLYAFDAFGAANCSGSPKSCTPLWTATTGDVIWSSPAVVKGVLYVGGTDGKLYAFDAAGNTNCSGTPKTCTPLWTAATGNPNNVGAILGPPAVANGVVYVTSAQTMYAFDAAGTTNCSGSPKTCAPLWTTSSPSGIHSNIDIAPAVANGIVYIAGSTVLPTEVDLGLLAFDARGITNCSGTPKTCSALWIGDVSRGDPNRVIETSAAVSNGVVYVNSFDSDSSGPFPTASNAELDAFDAAGVTNCSGGTGGTPKVCTQLWRGFTGDATGSSPAVAGGIVYTISDESVYAFNATCSGATCAPLWTGATTNRITYSSPSIENGVLFVGSDDGNLYAFDATGTTNCSGTPTKCTPLWSHATGGMVRSSAAPAGNTVFVGSEGGRLYAFGLP